MISNYTQGFMDKCAQYGMDPARLVKQADPTGKELDAMTDKMDVAYKPNPTPPPPPLKPYRKEVLADLPAGSGARQGRYDALKAKAQENIDRDAATRANKSK